MIAHGGVITIKDSHELNDSLDVLIKDTEKRNRLGLLNASFINSNKGAVIQIMDYIRN